MWGMYFLIFASCEPLSIVSWKLLVGGGKMRVNQGSSSILQWQIICNTYLEKRAANGRVTTKTLVTLIDAKVIMLTMIHRRFIPAVRKHSQSGPTCTPNGENICTTVCIRFTQVTESAMLKFTTNTLLTVWSFRDSNTDTITNKLPESPKRTTKIYAEPRIERWMVSLNLNSTSETLSLEDKFEERIIFEVLSTTREALRLILCAQCSA